MLRQVHAAADAAKDAATRYSITVKTPEALIVKAGSFDKRMRLATPNFGLRSLDIFVKCKTSMSKHFGIHQPTRA